LRTYVYEIWNTAGAYLGYYPSTPANVVFAYSVLGVLNPTGTLSGPTIVCSSGATYTVNNPSPGCAVSWEKSSNLNPPQVSGNTAFFSANGNGAGFVRAILTSGCGSVALPQKNVWVGSPVISNISGPIYTPNGQWASYYAEPDDPAMFVSDYNWILNPLNGNSVYDYGRYADIAFYNTGRYQLVVQAQNTCGWGPYTVTGLQVYDSYGLSFSPNPVNGETTLIIEAAKEKGLSTSEWEMEIYSQSQLLKEKKTKLKGNSTVINTSGWQDGVYIVRVKYEGAVLTGKLIVKQ
jgi:hypothetical protein